jgi:CRP-like cAMP-binding protein
MDLIEKMDFLKEVELFSELKEEKVLLLARLLSLRKYKKQSIIYQEDAKSSEFFLLKEGTVKIGKMSTSGKEMIKSIIHEGSIFGESGILGIESYDNFALAMDTSVLVYSVDIKDFKAFLQNEPALCWKLINNIGQKLKYAERRLESLIFKDARERIIDFLKDNARVIGQKVGYETLIKHSLTQQDIANFTGTSRQTVTSVMNDLKKTNQIYFKRRSILIRDMASLS